MKKRLFLGLLIAILLLFFSFQWYFNGGTSRKIKSGTIQYSKELGWINWGHAIPESTAKFYQEFKRKNDSCTDSFYFDYSQKMHFNFMGKSFSATHSEQWKINSKLSPEEVSQVFLTVFKSVSEGFEAMQGKFPYSISGGSISSFRKGDLTGNLISYYLAIRNLPLDSAKIHLSTWNVEDSYQKHLSEETYKATWDSIQTPLIESNYLVKNINEILENLKSPSGKSTKVSQNNSMGFE